MSTSSCKANKKKLKAFRLHDHKLRLLVQSCDPARTYCEINQLNLSPTTAVKVRFTCPPRRHASGGKLLNLNQVKLTGKIDQRSEFNMSKMKLKFLLMRCGCEILAREKIPLMTTTLLLLLSIATGVQALDKVKPMGEWAEHIIVQYDAKPLEVHLRTGYERAVIFPEPVGLHTINDIGGIAIKSPVLPNCTVEFDANVMAFAPLQRFEQQRVSVHGTQTGRIYDLIVSSSPTGKRQPIRVIR